MNGGQLSPLSSVVNTRGVTPGFSTMIDMRTLSSIWWSSAAFLKMPVQRVLNDRERFWGGARGILTRDVGEVECALFEVFRMPGYGTGSCVDKAFGVFIT
jgi:hypothetical protein